MLATLYTELDTGVDYLSFQKSSLLQGVIMEQVSPEYAEKLHLDGIKPYSQSVRVLNGKTIWQINTLESCD